MRSVLNEVIGPDVTFVGWSQAEAGSIIEPDSPAFRLFLWDFEPHASPYPVDTSNIEPPALSIEKRCDPTVSVTTILLCQVGHGFSNAHLIRSGCWLPKLCLAMLANHTTSSTFGNIKLIFNVIDCLALARGAQNFLLRCPSGP